MIRATLNVGFVCQTTMNKPVDPGKESTITRDDVSCRLIYAANGKCIQYVVTLFSFFIFFS